MADPVPAAPPTQFTLFADTLAGLDPALMKYFEPAIQEVRDRRVAAAVPLPAAAAVGGPLPAAAAVGVPLPVVPGAAAAVGGPLPGAAALPDAAAVGGPLPAVPGAAAAAAALPNAVHGGPAAGALLPVRGAAAGDNAAAAEEELRVIAAEMDANTERRKQVLRNDNNFQPALKAEITRILREINELNVEENVDGTIIPGGKILRYIGYLTNFLTANFVSIGGTAAVQRSVDTTPGLSNYITLITRLRDTTPDPARIEEITRELDYLPTINGAAHTITFRKYRLIRNTVQRVAEEITFDYTNRDTFNFNHTKLQNLSYRDILESFESVRRLVLIIYNDSNKTIDILIRRIIRTIETLNRSVREEGALQYLHTQKQRDLGTFIDSEISIDDAILEFNDTLRGPATNNEEKKAIVQAYHDLYAYYAANPTRTDVRGALRAGFPRIMQIYKSIEETRSFGWAKFGRNGMKEPKMVGGLRTRRRSRSHKRKTLRKVK